MAYRTWSTVNNLKIGEYVTREKWPVTAYEDFTPWPCVWEKSFISLPCIRQGTLSYGSFFFTIHTLIHHANSFFGKKNIADTTNIDHWSPTFTFFDWSRVQKDALFKALNSETVYRDPTNYTLLVSQKHITLNMRLRECPPPPSLGHTRVFCPTCIHSMWGKSLIWAKAKMQSNKKKNCGKLIKISITFFFFKNSIIYGHIRE